MLYFIVNEKSRSGRGAAVWQEVQEELRRKNIAYKAWVTEYAGHAFSLAREICEQDDADICLVAVGGDGTANEVINGITDFARVRFGVIPTGSGNDLARGLGLNGSPTENLNRIIACMEMGAEACSTLDLGQVSWKGGDAPRLFAISSGLGLDAIVCKKALKSRLKDFLNKLHLGKLTYLILTVQSLFSMRTTSAAVRYEKRDTQNLKKIIYIAAMNFKAEGGGVPMAPAADATDGMLSVCSAAGIPKWRTFFCLPFLVAAKHLWIRGFVVRDCAECEIHLAEPMVLHADGEYCGDVTEVRFRCLPKKLRVLLV
ncbi:MAG: YegS/Rv2252/BmrU family lipid kinase [Roseburia sp.]|nr:YegS/Rv2252/BmrU family lipid kinase [Roseburia sp.]